ncbi:MAG: N-acetylmuramidase domain-containing protein [Anaerolineae bacterium]
MTVVTVSPQPGSGGVFIRSVPRVENATQIGQLAEGVALELDTKGAEWHAAKVYVAASVAEVDGGFVKPASGSLSINIRAEPRIDPATDIGDVQQGQQLELIGSIENWFIARVFVTARFTVISDQSDGTPQPIDVPHNSPLTLAELQALSLTPAQRRTAPANATQAAFTAARIWNKYGGVIEPLANKIGIDSGAAVAVVAVESGGSGLGPDGRAVIRFENHLFWFNWGKAHADQYNQFFQFDQTTSWRGHKFRTDPKGQWQDVHTNQASEWAAFAHARSLDDHAAKLSISMGLVQILGSNFRAIGYDTVDAMFDAFSADERFQLLGFFNFVKNDQRQVTALQANDFTAFARIYNGPGQPDFYGGLIKGVFDGFKTLQTA